MSHLSPREAANRGRTRDGGRCEDKVHHVGGNDSTEQ